jgi:hypothetical protein
MHLFDKDVPRLGQLFKERFGQELIGEELTQFHSDFELKGAQGKPYSTYFIGLGKKCYIDVLEDGFGNSGLHIRMKGVPDGSIFQASDNQVVEMFEDMAWYEKTVTFDLTAGMKRFKMTKDFRQTTVNEFKRSLKFYGSVQEFSEADGDVGEIA